MNNNLNIKTMENMSEGEVMTLSETTTTDESSVNLIGENEIPAKKEFELAGGAAVGELDLKTGEFVTVIEDISPENSIMDIGISHVHKLGFGESLYGKDVRLNIEERLEKNTDTAIDADYIYTDSVGDKYTFKEYIYRILSNGDKEYLTITDKNAITFDRDQRLYYTVSGESEASEIFFEYRSGTEYELITTQYDIKNSAYLEQKNSEYQKVEEALEQYERYLKNYAIVNNNTGNVQYLLSHYIDDISKHNEFFDLVEREASMLLTLEEARNYKEALNNKSNYQSIISNLEFSNSSSTEINHYRNLLNNVNAFLDLTYARRYMCLPTIKCYLQEYYKAQNDKKYVEVHMPVRFLKVDQNVKGYNDNGQLVYVSNKSNVQAFIEYERFCEDADSMRLACITDGEEKSVKFEYNDDGMLEKLTDITGNDIRYTYVNQALTKINKKGNVLQTNFSDTIDFTLFDENTSMRSALNTTAGEIRIGNYSGPQIFTDETYDGIKVGAISYKRITFTKAGSGKLQSVTIQENQSEISREKFVFDTSTGNVIKYYKELDGVVTCCEHKYYDWDAKKIIRSSVKNSYLGKYTIEDFPEYNTETESVFEYYDDKKRVTKREYSQEINNGEEIRHTITYTYDNKKLIKKIHSMSEKTGESTNSSGSVVDIKTTTQYVTDYTYNASNDLIKEDSYYGDEIIYTGGTKTTQTKKEFVFGHDITEYVYDENGVLLKEVSYNTLMPTERFVKEYSQEESDETLAKESTYFDDRGNQVGVSAVTEDGIVNKVEKVYAHGDLVEMHDGNNTVTFTYDHKRRATNVNMNGVDVAQITYGDAVSYEKSDTETINVNTVEITDANGNVKKTYSDLHGNVIKKTWGETSLVECEYDNQNRISKLKDSVLCEESCVYEDRIDALKKFTRGNYVENHTYDKYGSPLTQTDTTTGVSYEYTYSDDVKHDLDTITVTANSKTLTIEPKCDVNKRNVGKVVKLGNTEIANEMITYKKVGDHATMLPASISYKNVLSANYGMSRVFDRNERLTYSYDEMGNIKEIRNNGVLTTRYTYDKLCRLIREDNKALDKTFVFEYDNNGNRLVKREYAFTLCNMDTLQETTPTSTQLYIYDGDKLSYIGSQKCTYDAVGMPTTYKGHPCSFERGLPSALLYTSNTYDGRGRLTGYSGFGKNYTITYDSQGRIVERSDGLKFFYDDKGVAGVIHNGTIYTYRRDVLGNVTALVDEYGQIVAKYVYDAWGNHEVRNNDGSGSITDTTHIGHLNPFRYRSYYYHESGLYWLNTRFYDASTGRFISPDDLSYLDPDSVNGLNLYAYCGNNPVTYSDPSGHSLMLAIIGLITFAVIGFGATVAVDYADDGEVFNGSVSVGGYIANTLIMGGLGALIGALLPATLTITLPSFGGMAFAGGGVAAATTIAISGSAILAGASAATIGAIMLFARTGKSGGYYGERWPGDHKPEHVHLKGNGSNIRIGKNGKPLPGEPRLSPQQRKALKNLWEQILYLFGK